VTEWGKTGVTFLTSDYLAQYDGLMLMTNGNLPLTDAQKKMRGSTWPLGEEFYEFGHAVWDASKPTENISQVGRLHVLYDARPSR
jgi:hypothetical protein